ncbi:MAG: hypothetical protein SVX43_13110, partial [Cyanobacteriota bacterium]|nr:hypothetical protein [Cyanobacteriota bacterium]
GQNSLAQLRRAAELACAPNSDMHRLPFSVTPDLAIAAMVSTTAHSGEGSRTEIPSLCPLPRTTAPQLDRLD